MASLYLLIPIALLLLAAAVAAFIWAVDHDQFEDLDTEGERILMEDEAPNAARPARGAKDQP